MAAIKKKLTFAGAVIILLLAVVIFVFIPTAGGASASPLVFGEWDGTPVEYVQDSFMIRQAQNISAQYQAAGIQVNDRMFYAILRQAYESAVLRLAILDDMRNARYKPTDREINRTLIRQYYTDENGRYSDTLYNNTDEYTKMSRRKLVQEELTAARYFYDCLGDPEGFFGLKTSVNEEAFLREMITPQRSFSYVTFDSSDYPDSEVVRFGEENAELFAALDLSLISFDDESEAARVHGQIAAGETSFAEAEAAYSTRRGTDGTGKLLNRMRKDVNTLFPDAADLEAVLSLGEGEISAPLASGASFLVVRCDGPQQPADFSDAETVRTVRDYMERNERGTIEDYVMLLAENFSDDAAAQGFDAALAEYSRTKSETSAFGINYGNSQALPPVDAGNEILVAAADSEEFFRTAFSIQEGDVSRPVMLNNGAIILTLSNTSQLDPGTADLYLQQFAGGIRQWDLQAIAEMYFSSSKFKDNFDLTYLRSFMGNLS